MRVTAVAGKCQGHQMCVTNMPEAFDADDDGFVVLLNDGQIPAGAEARARHAVGNCPERALQISSD